MLLRRGRDQRRRTTQGRILRNRAIAVAPVVEAMVKVVVFLPSWPANNPATRAGDAARILYSALAWPVTTLVIVAILRGPITELLRAIGQRATKFSVFKVEVGYLRTHLSAGWKFATNVPSASVC